MEYFISSGAGNTTFHSAGASAVAPYNLPLAGLSAGTYNLYAIATDSAGSPATAKTLTNTFVVAESISINLTAPANGATVDNNTAVLGTATVSGGANPYSVQFFLDNVANGSPATWPVCPLASTR